MRILLRTLALDASLLLAVAAAAAATTLVGEAVSLVRGLR